MIFTARCALTTWDMAPFVKRIWFIAINQKYWNMWLTGVPIPNTNLDSSPNPRTIYSACRSCFENNVMKEGGQVWWIASSVTCVYKHNYQSESVGKCTGKHKISIESTDQWGFTEQLASSHQVADSDVKIGVSTAPVGDLGKGVSG